MIEEKEFTLSTGTKIKVPCLQFEDLKNKIIIAFLGIDFKEHKEEFFISGAVELIKCGKLHEQRRYKVETLQRILIAENWDYAKYPNPEMLIVNKKSKIILN